MQIGIVLFPNVTLLDCTGPLQVMHRIPSATTHVIAKTLDPAPSDCGLSLVPTATFATAPTLDMVCVPGGFGVADAFDDGETLAFVREAGARAKYVTSVCTGAFILGAAGFLIGKRATTHWAYHHLLPRVGATPVVGRVVREGDIFTGGGVTSGIDFALTIAAEVAGEAVARRIQLSIEYDPAPPFHDGSPARAEPETLAAVADFFKQRASDFAVRLPALS